LQPFFTAGPSFRPASVNLSHLGITAGGGVEFHVGGFRISPTLRYTRWSGDNRLLSALRVNQVEMLVGIDRPSTMRGFSAFGRRLSVGLIAGIGLGADWKVSNMSPSQVAESNSGIFGVTLEAALPRNFALVANGLYRPLHGSELEFGTRVRFAHLTWEFPVLLKYRFGRTGLWRPFVEGGPSFRAEGNLNIQRVSHFGGAMGGGIEWNVGPLKVSPTVRYTRWEDKGDPTVSRTSANQTQVLFSVAF
jgi:hypothetical protein